MSDVVVVAAASLVSGAVSGVVVVSVERWFRQRDEAVHQRARRLADFAAASWAVTLELGLLARADMGEKDAIRSQMEVRADRINSAEALILLMDDDAVYHAARAVDRCQAELGRRAHEKPWDHDDWLETRNALLSPAVNDYYAVARKALGKSDIETGF